MKSQAMLHGPGIEWKLWSTTMRLVVAHPQVLPAAKQVVDNTLLRVERAVSRFDQDSEIRRLRPGRRTRISAEFAAILGATLDAARKTGGAVDPTVGSALVRLGYDRDIVQVRQRATGISVVAMPARGWRRLQFDRERRLLTIPDDTVLDLGALAKAWAADQAAAEVLELTGSPVLLSLGGDIATAGGEGVWNVLVRDLDVGPAALIGLPAGAAVATSSTRSRAWLAGHHQLHHILDPRRGLPAQPPWETVSVVARSCVEANTLSTALMVDQDQRALLLQRRLPARLVGHGGSVEHLGGWSSDTELDPGCAVPGWDAA
jgi:FAD:protein FMN transferase